jgi:hypothetical protein
LIRSAPDTVILEFLQRLVELGSLYFTFRS